MRKGTRLQPLFYGGRHERSRRAGTENVPGIVGLGKAAKLAKEALDRGDDQKMAAMRDRLQQGILAQVEDAGVNGDGAPRVPNTMNIHFDHIDGEAMVIAMDLKGLAVSTGAACSSGAIEPSHVLIAMGLRPDQARASIRFQPRQADGRRRDRYRVGARAGDSSASARSIADVREADGESLRGKSNFVCHPERRIMCAKDLCTFAGVGKLHRFFASLRMTCVLS